MGNHWIVDPDDEMTVEPRGEGMAASEPTTVYREFKKAVEARPDHTMLVGTDGRKWTTKQYYDDTIRAAKSLIKMGFLAHQCISIIGFNSPEWVIADLGAIAAGGIAAGIYTTNGPEACQYVIEHSKSFAVFAENKMQLDKILAVKDNLPSVKAIVVWDKDFNKDEYGKDFIWTWDQFMKYGDDADAKEVEERIELTRPGHVATLIYTSGTTGQPKAVMITHDNLTWTVKAVVEGCYNIGPKDRMVSFLPLSHVAAQMIDIHNPIVSGACVYFADKNALKGSLVNTLQAARPTVFLAVPRVWEKIQEKMLAIGAANKGIKRALGNWAKRKGLAAHQASFATGKPAGGLGYSIAKALIFKKVQSGLGLNECRIAATAAAPISMDTLNYFMSLDLRIYEIYGMSESTGPQTVNMPGKHKPGCAGPTFPGAETKLDNPDAKGEGEICMRGRHVFAGYMYNKEATAKTIDEDGWLHSGDVGKVDAEGFLSITGRIKELIVTAGGENVPPVLIEDEIKKELPAVSNVVVIGDKRKFLSCLITMRVDPVAGRGATEYQFDDKINPTGLRYLAAAGVDDVKTIADAQKSEKLKKHIMDGLTAANGRATSNAQKVQKFVILDNELSVEGGELTATQKLKRRIVSDKYSAQIESMYS